MAINNIINKGLVILVIGILLWPLSIPPAQANQWVEITPINIPRSRTSLAYIELTNKFYLIGGETSFGDTDIPIEEYDPTLNTWVNKTFLMTGVSNTGVATINNLIYIPGGYTGTDGIANLQILNPTNRGDIFRCRYACRKFCSCCGGLRRQCSRAWR